MLGFAVLCGVILVFTAAIEQLFDVTAEVKMLAATALPKWKIKLRKRVKGILQQ